MLFYILQRGRPKHVSSGVWAHWFEDHSTETVIAVTKIGSAKIETVFKSFVMGNALLADPPLWESTVIGGPLDGQRTSCSGTVADARRMHSEMVGRVDRVLNHQPHNN
jgi:hypothetical protein